VKVKVKVKELTNEDQALTSLFENFERNETHLWPREDDTHGARHEIQVIADDGSLLRTFDIRDITKELGLKFLGRRVDITG
jgi:hypothetical protein